MNTYNQAIPVAHAKASARVSFIRKTYAHLAIAILLFAIIESFLLQEEIARPITEAMMSTSWILVLAIFMGVSHLANWWASSQTSIAMQYLGLGLYIIAEAVIFVPLLYIAQRYTPGIISQAAVATLTMFGGLTATVFVTRKDFNFLGPILTIGGFVAIGLIISGTLFGFTLGTLFSGLMVLFASAAILFHTSKVMNQYNTNQHVAAALSLFASIALLFWYILRIFMSRD